MTNRPTRSAKGRSRSSHRFEISSNHFLASHCFWLQSRGRVSVDGTLFYRFGRRRSILRANRSLLDRQIVLISLDFIATGR